MSDPQPPLLANATRDLARFGAALQYEDIPAEVVARIKLSLLDSLGCCLFGATLPWTRKVALLAEGEGARPVASLTGFGRKSSVSLAVLVNSTAGRAFELDDIHKESIVHAGSLATPVALALAEQHGAMTDLHCAWEYRAQGVTAAQMNLYYGLAVIALDGMAFTRQYREDRLRDPRILDFIGRISARIDPQIEGMGAAFRHAARVTVTARDGRVFETLALDRRGSPENPLAPDDIEHKFMNVVADCVDSARAERIVRLVSELERLDTVSELIALVSAPVKL